VGGPPSERPWNIGEFIMNKINLVSTVLLASWDRPGSLVCTPLKSEEFLSILNDADEVINFCGHPITTVKIREAGVTIPDQLMQLDKDGEVKINNFTKKPQGAFWDGHGVAVAARPKAGVRGSAAAGDTNVSSLDELEFMRFEFIAD